MGNLFSYKLKYHLICQFKTNNTAVATENLKKHETKHETVRTTHEIAFLHAFVSKEGMAHISCSAGICYMRLERVDIDRE